MDYIKKCEEEFEKLPSDIKSVLSEEKNQKFLKELENEYDVELSFLIKLVLIGELKIEDVPEYMQKKHDLDKESVNNIKSRLVQNIFISLIGDTEEKIGDALLSYKEKEVREELQEGLLELLNASREKKERINELILSSFTIESDVLNPDKVSRIILNNKEELTSKKFVMDEHRERPSVANWIKYYTKQKGSQNFDNLSISDFLTGSANSKILDLEEKEALRKVLLLYRNVKFFPDPFVDLPLEKWNFIPLEEDVKEIKKTRAKVEGSKESFQENISRNEGERVGEKEKKSQGLNKEKISELEDMAKQYEENSLERKAVEEEIKKIKEQNNQ